MVGGASGDGLSLSACPIVVYYGTVVPRGAISKTVLHIRWPKRRRKDFSREKRTPVLTTRDHISCDPPGPEVSSVFGTLEKSRTERAYCIWSRRPSGHPAAPMTDPSEIYQAKVPSGKKWHAYVKGERKSERLDGGPRAGALAGHEVNTHT